MNKQEQKVKEQVGPLLEDGEELLAAVIARPRGWTQSHAGSLHIGAHQQGKSRSAGREAGFPLASPMSLAVTDRRLLSISIGSPIGLGKGGNVKEIVGAVALAEVDSIESKRLLAGKVLKLHVNGEEIKLEVNAAADVKGLIAALEGAKSAAV
jgi:hypothetical protein